LRLIDNVNYSLFQIFSHMMTNENVFGYNMIYDNKLSLIN